MNACRGAGLIPYNPEHVLGKLPRSIIPSPRNIVTTTLTTNKRIQVASDALLTRVTLSLRAHVELLQTVMKSNQPDPESIPQMNLTKLPFLYSA